MALDDQGHDVGAEEAAAADHYDVPKGGYRLWTGRHGGSIEGCWCCGGRAEVRLWGGPASLWPPGKLKPGSVWAPRHFVPSSFRRRAPLNLFQ